MNFVKKAVIRTIHGVFYIAKPFLPYHEPTMLDSIDKIPELLLQKEKHSVLLVTDENLHNSGMIEPLKKALGEKKIKCTVYDKTRPNPTVDNVEEAKKLYIEKDCDCMVAFGGGSAMDCAKGVGACIAKKGKSINQLKGTLKVLKKIPLLLAIPTTSGTGSEATPAAVITDAKTKHKYTVNDFVLVPKYAVLDPKITYSLPKHLTSTTGMDALTHAVEAYVGISTTNKTRAYATEAVKLIFENIETAYADGQNHKARENMLRASYLAGVAFSNSYVGYIHAVAHTLGGRYNVPHGLANSVLMPYVLEAYGKSAHKKLHKLAIAAGVSSENDSAEVGAKKFIEAIRALNRRMNIPDKLEGIIKEDIPGMAEYAAKEAHPIYPVPKLMDKNELEQFYYKAADWSK